MSGIKEVFPLGTFVLIQIIGFVFSTNALFPNLKPTFTTMQQPLSDISGGESSGNISLELQKALDDFSHICSRDL